MFNGVPEITYAQFVLVEEVQDWEYPKLILSVSFCFE